MSTSPAREERVCTEVARAEPSCAMRYPVATVLTRTHALILALAVSFLPSMIAQAGGLCAPGLECKQAGPQVVTPQFKKQVARAQDVVTLSAPKSDWSVGPEQPLNAPCTRKDPFTEEEMEKHVAAYLATESARENRTIHGIVLENENPKLLDLFALLTTHEDPLDDATSAQRTWAAAQWNQECRKVACAMKKLFGEKESHRLLFLLTRYGFNASHFQNRYSDPWKPEELDEVLLAISDFPEGTFPQEKSKTIVHYRRNERQASSTIADAVVTVYPGWDKLPRGHRRSAIFHELAHNMSKYLGGMDESPEWYRLGDWEKVVTPESAASGPESVDLFGGAVPSLKTPERAISQYGMTNPGEDWAESVTAARYNPEELKRRAPEKYQLIREMVFDGLEYTSEEACQPGKSLRRQLSEKVHSEFNREGSVTQAERDRVTRECTLHIARWMRFRENPRHEAEGRLKDCVKKVLFKNAAERKAREKEVGLAFPEQAVKGVSIRTGELPSTKRSDAAVAEQKRQVQEALADAMLAGIRSSTSHFQHFERRAKSEGVTAGAMFCSQGLGVIQLNFRRIMERLPFERTLEYYDEILTEEFAADLDRGTKDACLGAFGSMKKLAAPSREKILEAISR